MCSALISAALACPKRVEGVDRFARRASDQRLAERGERGIAIGHRCADLDDRIAAVVGVDAAAGLARSAEMVGLTVGVGAPALPEPPRHRLGMDGVGEARERRTERLLAQVPGEHAKERPPACDAADVRHAAETEVRGLGDERR